MAYDPETLLKKVRSYLAASARFPGGTSIGEPKSAPSGMHAAVLLGSMRIVEAALSTGSGRIDVVIRLYRNAFSEPLESTELLFGKTVFELLEDFSGDFDFGDSNVRTILPLDMVATPGYVGIGPQGAQTMFRVVDITIPVLVNDVVTWTK